MLSRITDPFTRFVSPETIARFYRSMPPWLAQRTSLERFRRTVRWAGKHSPFYREAFAERGIDAARVRTPADLGDFYTTPDDLAARAEDFVCGRPDIVFESSGTSGRNKRVYFSRQELDEMGQSMAAGLKMMGLAPADRVANAFDFNIWIPGLTSHYGLMHAGNFCLAFGKVDPQEVYRRLEQYKFTAVLGEPTWLIRLTEIAERDGCRYPLKFLIGGAEEMPAAAVPWMKRVWHGATVKMCYGTVEQGHSIGFQPCPRDDGYHIDNFDFLSELIEPDADGYGELVFTTLRRRIMPLIRYRTRDVTRFTQPCPCGIRAPRIEKLRGRRDELIVASGGNLYPLMFEQMLRPIPGVGRDFQIIFKLEGVREILEFNLETTRTDTAALFGEIKLSASDLFPDLMKNLAIGIFDMRLRTHDPNTLRAGRKLKRIIDIRHHPDSAAAQSPVPSPAPTSGVPDEQLV